MSDKKKIPYNVEPIVRDHVGPQNRQGKIESNSKLSASLFLIAILVFNIALAVTVIFSLARGSSGNQVYVTNNLTAENVEVSAVASVTKLSVVCIGTGGSDDLNNLYSQTNLPTRNAMFSKTKQNGAGVIIDIDKNAGTAYILTCYHVIGTYPSAVFVLLYDANVPVYASVVGYSISNDLAVLKIADNSIKSSICTATTTANSEFIAEGDFVLAVGNPQGKGFAVSNGVVSRPLATFNSSTGDKMRGIQVDAAINGGNSGGGLFNSNGQFLGIVQSKVTNSETDNVAYAIPANLAMNIAKKLIKTNGILTYMTPGYTVSTSTNVQFVNGKYYSFKNVFVETVTSGSDAARAGLKAGDKIESITFGDRQVQVLSEYTYEDLKYALSVGDSVTYNILRGNSQIQLQVNFTSSSSASQR